MKSLLRAAPGMMIAAICGAPLLAHHGTSNYEATAQAITLTQGRLPSLSGPTLTFTFYST